ncbi:TPA: DNA repair protein RecN [Candidatus Poribacteria bacterium]|nr:DNA repair protein RecN [Candidatus Poribacteria bacterium]
MIKLIQELNIRNFALIDEIQLELSEGLNILTGETGAGKSIIIGAVSLVLGERGSADVVRSGANNAIIESAVDISLNRSVHRLLEEADLYSREDDDTLLLARQIASNGRSRCHINGRLATISLLKDVGDLLVDIHGQHEHQSLFRPEKHLELLDSFGGLVSLREKVTEKYTHILRLQSELVNLERDRKARLREQEFLEFQLNELEEAKLQAGEDEKLLAERKILNNAETLFELANTVYAKLYGSNEPEDFAIIDGLKSLGPSMSKICQIDGELKELDERLKSCLYELEDIARLMREYRDRVEFNPLRLEEVESRLDLIFKLKRKYGDTIKEILEYQANVAQALDDLSLSSERISELRNRIDKATEEARKISFELSEKRRECSKKLERLIERELHTLGMDKTVFRVLVEKKEARWQDGKGRGGSFPTIENNGKQYELGPDGIDEIEFLISPNVGEELKPLTKIASGGEISRVMLALKTILAEIDEMPTMIFDEIDADIGGRTAYVIGQKLKQIAKVRQVLCVTHLPQIACMADAHFVVEKKVYSNRTKIEARRLNKEERVHEIARMLGGQNTEITLAHAKEMLERKWEK